MLSDLLTKKSKCTEKDHVLLPMTTIGEVAKILQAAITVSMSLRQHSLVAVTNVFDAHQLELARVFSDESLTDAFFKEQCCGL